ncbi:heat shock 70 kDa protein 14-like protein, partial [Tanacetum coccineum]
MLSNTSLILDLLSHELKKLIAHFIPMISLKLLIEHLCDCSFSTRLAIQKQGYFSGLRYYETYTQWVLQVEAPKKKVNKSNIPVSEVVYGAMLPADVQQAVEKEFKMALQDCVEAPKKKVNKSNIPVSEVVYGAMLPADVQQAVEKEFEMALQDCVVEETKDKKNVVEAYFYQLIKSSARKASTAAAAPKCCLSNVLVLKEVSHYCLGTRMICGASVYFMLLMQDLMMPVVISYVNAAIDTTAIGFKRRSPGYIFTLTAIAKWECSSYGRALALHARGTG